VDLPSLSAVKSHIGECWKHLLRSTQSIDDRLSFGLVAALPL
jgi:hypothetical protein